MITCRFQVGESVKILYQKKIKLAKSTSSFSLFLIILLPSLLIRTFY